MAGHRAGGLSLVGLGPACLGTPCAASRNGFNRKERRDRKEFSNDRYLHFCGRTVRAAAWRDKSGRGNWGSTNQ
jgi:hypothetical protein